MSFSDNFIGKGGSSKVYRGHLPNGREVAVKILKQTKGVLNDFVAEIEIITALNHKNVISLLGYCFENSSLLLAYNYLSRGSLEENLHGKDSDLLYPLSDFLNVCGSLTLQWFEIRQQESFGCVWLEREI